MSSAVTAENSDANGDATEQKIEGDPEAAAVIEESPSEQSEVKAEGMNHSKVFILEPIGMALNIVGLGLTEPMKIMVGHHEIVREIRQIVYVTPETCYKTSFTIQLEGQRLDEFTDFASVRGLKDDSTLKLVEEPYTLRDSKVHVRRVRELLISTINGNLGLVYGEGQSPSLLSTIMQADPEERLASCSVSKTEKESGIDFTPPDYILPPKDDQDASTTPEPPLTPLLLNHQEPKFVQCIQDITYSSWNPPPGSRKMKGDLLYLDVVTLDDKKYCITGTPAGFYVNRCDDNQFNPNPAKDPCKDYTLIGLLSQLIPSFRKNFALLTKSCIKDDVIEQCPSPFDVNVWVAQRQQHTRNSLRADDAVSMWSLVHGDELTGQNREWHEELMQVREMPKTTLQQQIVRMRSMFKWTSEFVAAATKASCLAVDGNIYPVNPTADERMLMYQWNNVLLIYAKDSNSLYSAIGGDEAAHVIASNDLKGIDAFNKMDVSGIYTIGSTVVDYRGRRLIAQTAVPGLRRSQSQGSEVSHGSLDLGKTIAYCEKFEKLLKEPADKLRLRKHKVLNEKDEELKLHFSADSKGILGTDGRYYIVDLWRVNPPDVNFLDVPRISKHPVEDVILSDEENKDEEKDKPPFQFPKHKHFVHTLRPEAISNFVRVRYFKYLKIAALQMAESQRPSKLPQGVQPSSDHGNVGKDVGKEPNESDTPTGIEPLQEDGNLPETSLNDSSPPSQEDDAIGANGLPSDATGVKSEASDCNGLSSEPASAEEEEAAVEATEAKHNSGDLEMADTLGTDPTKETCNSQLQSPDSSGPSDHCSTLSEVDESEQKGGVSASEKEFSHTEQEIVNGEVCSEQEQVQGEVAEFLAGSSSSSSSELDYAKKLRTNKFTFVTASEQGTLHSNDPQTEEALVAAAKIAGSSSDKEFTILFNPDVYGPYRAADSEEVLMSDRLLVQEAADHLLHKIIPNLIKGMASTVLVPIDGIALASLMRSRGINMRYLGKIAYLVANNNKLDHVFRICVLEMIARGVKRVFRRYLHEAANLHTTASAVAHLLNCLLGSSDSYQLPPVLDEQLYRSTKTKKKRSRKRGGGGGGGKPQLQNDKTASGVDGLGTALNAVTPALLWQEVIDDTSSYYGYQLHQCSNCQAAVDKYGFRRVSLLRLVCKKLGFQLVLREYDFSNKKQLPFTDDDVVDIVPIVKHVTPTAGDTTSLCEGAEARIHTGRFAEALGTLLEAVNIYQQVYGAIHEDLGTVFRLLARIHFLMEDLPQAISYQKKAAVVCERALGMDHPETIVAYVHLGLYCHSAGQVSIALRLMYRARYLILLTYGEGHPDLATFDTNIGLMLHGLKKYKLSLRFLQSALKVQIKYQGEESIPSAMGYHLVARALVNTGEVQQAIQEEKKAFNLYSKLLGPDDVRTKGSRDCVKQLTRVAVEMQQKMNATRTQQDQEITADQELLMSMLHHFNHPRMEPVVGSSVPNSSSMPIPPSSATILEMPDVE